MKLKVSHSTSYEYDSAVPYALQQVRLTPINTPQQTVINWSVEIDGATRELAYDDHYGNATMLVRVKADREAISFVASGEVETHDTAGVLGKTYGAAPLWHFKKQTERTRPGKGSRALAKALRDSDHLLSDLHNLSQAILEAVPYDTTRTSAQTTAEEAVSAGGGVCQDHVQIFLSAARLAGVPARYVSGYLMMDDRVDQDASHAWAEAHLEDLGWVGFDISNGISPDERYVKLATGLDSSDAAPISGMRLGSASESMIVSLQVQQ